MEDHYATLGVRNLATKQEITHAYRKKALELHPDRNHGSDTTAAFQKLQKAYEILSDPIKRDSYDKLHRANQGYNDPPPTQKSETTNAKKACTHDFNFFIYPSPRVCENLACCETRTYMFECEGCGLVVCAGCYYVGV